MQDNTLKGNSKCSVQTGRTETSGGLPPLLGTSPRDLTIDDALALKRSHSVQYADPVVVGAAPVSYGSREREVMIYGSGHDLINALELSMLKAFYLSILTKKMLIILFLMS